MPLSSQSPSLALTPSATIASIESLEALTQEVTPLTSVATSTESLNTGVTPSLVCPYLHGRTEIGVLQSDAMAEHVRYLVHLPPCYDEYPTKAFPVVFLFHGWPLDEWHWMDLGIDQWSDDWVSRGIVGPFIIVLPGVSPNGLYVNSSGGEDSFEGFVVGELVPRIDQTYRTVREPWGRAVGGVSRGAVWALEIAMRHRDVFGAVGAHSPALALNRPLPQYDPFLLAGRGIGELRVYLDAGDVDWARGGAIRLRDLLLEVNADVVYQVHQGAHVDDLWRGAVPDYLRFYTANWPLTYAELPRWHDVGSSVVRIAQP